MRAPPEDSPRRLLSFQQLGRSETDVPRNLSEQRRGDVPSSMEWNRRASAIGMAVLPVRATLTNLREAEAFEQSGDFTGLQDGEGPHV